MQEIVDCVFLALVKELDLVTERRKQPLIFIVGSNR